MTTAFAATFAPLLAAAVEERHSAVVSLHDVAPATREATEEILNGLRKTGVNTCSLLVVPNYHHRGASMADPDFVCWLRQLEAAGHEIVVHGYYHQRPQGASEGLRDRLMTRVYTANEGEFYDISYDDALKRLVRAREEFAAAGLKPCGFIAPAWLLGAEAERAVRDCEFEYTTRLTTVNDLRFARSHRARSLVYSVRSGWRRTVSCLWNAAVFRRLTNAPLMRMSLHPPDIRCNDVWQQILQFARTIAATRHVITYADWVAQERVRRDEQT